MTEAYAGRKIIRLVQRVLVVGPGGEESVRAKVDKVLATKLRLVPTGSKVTIKASAAGQRVERPLVDAAVAVAGRTS